VQGDGGAYVSAVARLIELHRIDVLLPVTEAALLRLLPERERLGVVLPFPDDDAFRAISDRERLLAAAAERGIAVPAQLTLRAPEDARRLELEPIEFPIVLKPARSTARVNGRLRKLGVLYAADRRDLRASLADLPSSAYPHRRIREKPPSGGVSVCCEGISPDPALVAQSRALLDRFGWEGVAMVEWKMDAARGIPFLMEVNARFWGSLQLAVDSGVDFPAWLVAAATGEPLPYRVHGRPGRRIRWWWGDVDHLLSRLRRTPAELSLPPDALTRWETLRDVLMPWRPGQRGAVFRWRDPWPFARETAAWLSDVVGRRARQRSEAKHRALSAQECV
jgi:predicted ATP-grasp superfamily ATP-dependent carboligase